MGVIRYRVSGGGKGTRRSFSFRKLVAWLDEPESTGLGVLLGFLAFAMPLCLYLCTCMREPGHFMDYIEMAMIGKVWGLPHPPGFPLYLILNGLASMLPFGTLTFRVALVSAVSVAVTSHLTYRIARILNFGHMLSFGAALLTASSYAIWKQAIITDCYGLMLMLIFLTLWALFKWDKTRNQTWLRVAIWTFMLGMATHPSVAVALPGLLLFVILRNPKALASAETLVHVAGSLLVAASLYSYVYFRSLAHPVFNPYMLDGDLRKFVDFVTAKEFQALAGWKPDHMSQTWSTFIGMGMIALTKWGWYAAWVGVAAAIIRYRMAAVPLILIPICLFAYTYYYHTWEIESRLSPIYPFAVLMALTLCVWAIEGVPDQLRSGSLPFRKLRLPLRAICFALIGVILAAGIARNTALNLRVLDWSGPSLGHAQAERVIDSVERPCLILTNGDPDATLQLLFCIITDPSIGVERFPLLSDLNRVFSPLSVLFTWNRELLSEAASNNMHVYLTGKRCRTPQDTGLGVVSVYSGDDIGNLFELKVQSDKS